MKKLILAFLFAGSSVCLADVDNPQDTTKFAPLNSKQTLVTAPSGSVLGGIGDSNFVGTAAPLTADGSDGWLLKLSNLPFFGGSGNTTLYNLGQNGATALTAVGTGGGTQLPSGCWPNGSYLTSVAPHVVSSKSWLAIAYGTNDVVTQSAATIEGWLTSLYVQGRTDGFKIIATTIPPRGWAGTNALSGPQETVRQTVNQWIRITAKDKWDYLVDLDALYPQGAEPSHFTTGLHYNIWGTLRNAAYANDILQYTYTPNYPRSPATMTAGDAVVTNSHHIQLGPDVNATVDIFGGGAQSGFNNTRWQLNIAGDGNSSYSGICFNNYLGALLFNTPTGSGNALENNWDITVASPAGGGSNNMLFTRHNPTTGVAVTAALTLYSDGSASDFNDGIRVVNHNLRLNNSGVNYDVGRDGTSGLLTIKNDQAGYSGLDLQNSAGTSIFKIQRDGLTPTVYSSSLTNGLLSSTSGVLGNTNLTGAVTTSGGVATTLAANAVANSNLATMAANTVKMNNTGSSATPTDVTTTNAFIALFKTVAVNIGDLVYGGTSGTPSQLTANTTTGKKFLAETGTGSAGQAPSWFDLFNTANGWVAAQYILAGDYQNGGGSLYLDAEGQGSSLEFSDNNLSNHRWRFLYTANDQKQFSLVRYSSGTTVVDQPLIVDFTSGNLMLGRTNQDYTVNTDKLRVIGSISQTSVTSAMVTTDSNGKLSAATENGAYSGPITMTSNSTGTITFNNSSHNETIYNSSGSALATATITLPTTSTAGQIVRYTTAVVTVITMAGGTVDLGASVGTTAANGSYAWQCDTNGHWIRIQ